MSKPPTAEEVLGLWGKYRSGNGSNESYEAFQDAYLRWKESHGRVADLAKKLHAKFSLTGHLAWSEVEALLVELCGPLDRRKRCSTCGGDGRVQLGKERMMDCPSCEDGYTKGGD